MIQKLQPSHASAIAAIHVNALTGGFLPSLGKEFLTALNEGVLDKPSVFGFVYLEKNTVKGFVLGTENMDTLFKTALFANFFSVSYFLIIQILKNPRILKHIVESFSYIQKESGPPAELVVIALVKSVQNKGIGKKLVHKIETEMKKRKIQQYKLTVTTNNNYAYSFYTKLGFTKHSEFTLYNKDWHVMVKNI